MAGTTQPPPGLDEAFARLQAQLQSRHFKKALKTCDEGAPIVWGDPGGAGVRR